MRFSQPLLFISTCLLSYPVYAAEQIDNAWVWDLVIAAIVLSVAIASAALPIAAYRRWTSNWRYGAMLPFLILFIWTAVILIAKLQSPSSHGLWPLELFAWAMLNMIYMVSLMTVKRIFEKADAQASGPST